jgi:hypothetical protein
MRLTRRTFLKATRIMGGAAVLGLWPGRGEGASRSAPSPVRIALVKTHNHRDGVVRALRLLTPLPLQGRPVVIKPNLNSSHPFPAASKPTGSAVTSPSP